MVYKTLMLELYRPSKFKQGIIDDALLNYTQALQFLLDSYKEEVMGFSAAEHQVSRSRLLALIDKDTAAKLNDFHVQPFKDSLKMDFANTAFTYLTLLRKNKTAKYPSVSGGKNGVHSLYFGRYAHNRDYCLLYDEYTGRFYAKIYLLNLARRIPYKADPGRLSLKHVLKGYPPLLNQPGQRRYLVMPLAMGENQYKDLLKALNNPEIVRTARLTKRKNKYYLMVNMKCATQPPVKTISTMGVARDSLGGLHYTVLSQNGKVLQKGHLQAAQNDQKNFILSGKIVKTALEYQAQVILEADGGKNDKVSINKGHSARPMTISQYLKIAQILKYKLPEQRLPLPVEVSANALYHTCPACSNRTIKNCLSPEVFACIECGYASPLDTIGSMNLAGRLKKYASDKVPVYTRDTDRGTVYYNKILGFSCIVPAGRKNHEQVYHELQRYTEDAAFHREDKKKYALLTKLRQSSWIGDAVRIVTKERTN